MKKAMAMLRITSFLTIIILAVPIVSDCCLPAIHGLPFHESSHSDDEECLLDEQAIPETKGTAAARITTDYRNPLTAVLIPERSGSDRYSTLEGALRSPQDGINLYLRNGALRI